MIRNAAERSRTGLSHDPNRLSRQALHDLSGALRLADPIPPPPSIPPLHLPFPVELHRVLLCLGIGRVPYERDALVDLDDGRVEGRGAADVEVEDAGAGLVADEEEVAEAARDEQRVLVTFALEQRICRDGRREPDVVCSCAYTRSVSW